MDGQLSQTSPIPSPSVSSWLGLITVGQLSCESGIPSPSKSGSARATLKLAVSKTAEIDSRATKSSDLKRIKAREESFGCFFIGVLFCSSPYKRKKSGAFQKR